MMCSQSLMTYINKLRSESRCALTEGVGNDVHERVYRPELVLNWIKQLHTLPVLHFNHCLTTEYSETTAHCNGNFDTDNQFSVPGPKCTETFRTHCIYIQIASNCISLLSVRGWLQKFMVARILWHRVKCHVGNGRCCLNSAPSPHYVV
jgi:hypothetical protein